MHKKVEVVESDLKLKHQLMRGSVFTFLRATFYRWASLWQETCPDLDKGPRVLAVGDLHVENFGTWRDTEGRLVWGVNDFDEVAPRSPSHERHLPQAREWARPRRRCGC